MPSFGATLWLRVRAPVGNAASGSEQGLQVTFSDAGGSSTFYVNAALMGGTTSTPSFPRTVDGYYILDLRIAYRMNGRAYLTSYLAPFVQIPVAGTDVDTPPQKPSRITLEVDDAGGNVYEVEWLLVGSAATDPVAYGSYQNFLPLALTTDGGGISPWASSEQP